MDSTGSFVPAPDGASFVVPQYQRIGALYDFPRQDKVATLLLYFGTGESDLVAFAETEPHVFKECLGAEIDVEKVRPVLHEQVGGVFLTAFGGQLQLFHRALH